MAGSPAGRIGPAGRTGWVFLLPFLAGAVLRLWGLFTQIPVDDEWHSLNFVLGKTFLAAWTTHGLGANCIPQNVINWILLHTTGWSETTLFLPSALCGLAGLAIFPILVARLAGRRAALVFAWLFAISPCVVFYSRILRPYPMVLFFGFLALLALALWLREGRRGFLGTYVAAGFLAVYFHLYAALPVLAPLVALFLLVLLRPHSLPAAPWINRKTLFVSGLLLAVLLMAFLGPAHWRNPWWLHVLGTSHVTGHGLWEFLSLLAGTPFAGLKIIFAALVAGGWLRLVRSDLRLGLVFSSIWAAFLLLVIFGTQDGMHAGIQVARYNIILFPLALLQAAVALDATAARLPAVFRPAPAVALILALAAGSPLWRTFRAPNNFMHHSAFQDSYAPFDWTRSRLRALTPLPQMPAARIPAFYAGQAAAPDVRGIIEYPMFIGDPLNFHYFYQHLHRKPVAVGYVPDIPFPPLFSHDDFVVQDTPLDYVFSRAHALGLDGRMHFSRLVPLTDLARLRRQHSGWLLVVHRDLLRETLDVQVPGGNFQPPALLPLSLEAALGRPVFADSQILAWRIP